MDIKELNLTEQYANAVYYNNPEFHNLDRVSFVKGFMAVGQKIKLFKAKPQRIYKPRKIYDLSAILNKVCNALGFPVEAVKNDGRKIQNVWVRYIYILYAMSFEIFSQEKITREVGLDHSIIKNVKDNYNPNSELIGKTQPDFYELYIKFQNYLKEENEKKQNKKIQERFIQPTLESAECEGYSGC